MKNALPTLPKTINFTETVQATMYSPKSLDKETSFAILDKQLSEQSQLENKRQQIDIMVNQHFIARKVPNYFPIENNDICDTCFQQYNHSSPNFYCPRNQSDTNKLIERHQTTDFLLNNNEHSNQRKSLDSYDMSSQTSRFDYFLDNHGPAQWHPADDTHNNNISSSRSSLSNINSEQNGLSSNDLVPTLPRPIPTSSYGPYSFNSEDEENRGHKPLYLESIFKPLTIPDSQQLRPGPPLQLSIQQRKNRTISMDINHNFNDQKNGSVNDIDEISDEMNNKRSSLLGIKSFSGLPSFLEPHFQQSACCNELCCDDNTCGYKSPSSPNHNDNMSYSWDTHFNTSLGPIQPPSSEDAQPTIPLYRWENQVIALPNSTASLHLAATNNYLEQASSSKRALQDDEISFNESDESSNSYHFTNKRTKAFVENQVINLSPNIPLLSIGSNISGYEQNPAYQKFEIKPKIDMNNVVPETPEPPVDSNDPRPDVQPRRQKLRYPGDMYTPQWVRFSGHAKEGYCDNCKPGKWLQLKNSAYWYHKQFFHGISSVSGKVFVPPVETRKFDAGDCTEGLCHQCNQWVPIATRKKKNSMLWFRHAHKCHVYIKPKSYPLNSKKQ